MRIAVYTLTRDRLEYTQRAFALLWERAGLAVDHYVIDNGSQDGTPIWLTEHADRFCYLCLHPVNLGISQASNQALDAIQRSDRKYDIIVKMDNDCEIITPYLFSRMTDVYEMATEPLLLSPRVEGISRQPVREYTFKLGDFTIGRTGIVGGLCHWLSAAVYQQYRYPVDLSLAKGQDDAFCDWVYQQDIGIGYVEELAVAHMDTTEGQAVKYPEYFQRKWEEEKRASAYSA